MFVAKMLVFTGVENLSLLKKVSLSLCMYIHMYNVHEMRRTHHLAKFQGGSSTSRDVPHVAFSCHALLPSVFTCPESAAWLYKIVGPFARLILI